MRIVNPLSRMIKADGSKLGRNSQQNKDNILVCEGLKLIVHRHRESPVLALASLR